MKYRHITAMLCCVVSVSLMVLIANAIGINNEESHEIIEEVSDADASDEAPSSHTLTTGGVGRQCNTDSTTSETTAVEESEITQTDMNISSTVQEESSADATEETEESTMEVTTFNSSSIQEIYEFTNEVASYYGLDPIIMMKLMAVESNYNPYAVSSTGDHGICQINENWYSSYITWNDDYDTIVSSTGCNLYDVQTNIIISARQLRYWKDYSDSQGYPEGTYLELYNKGYKGIYYTDYRTSVLNAQIPN